MKKADKPKIPEWLSGLFGGQIGDVVKSKKASKKQLEDAVKEVSKKRKDPNYVK